MKRTLIAGLLLLSMLVGTTAVFAESYVSGEDSVDSGGHLDWDYDSKYYSEIVWGMDLWNDYKSNVIREDNLTVVEDILMRDMDSSTAGYYGKYFYHSSMIYFNDYGMNLLDSDEKEFVAAHELGHALGLAHNTGNMDALMANWDNFPRTLDQDDKDSYDEAAESY